MQVRNIGIMGYAVLFPIAAGVLAHLFRQPCWRGQDDDAISRTA
jgi:hypothetical protein